MAASAVYINTSVKLCDREVARIIRAHTFSTNGACALVLLGARAAEKRLIDPPSTKELTVVPSFMRVGSISIRLVLTIWLATICLVVPPNLFAQTGPKPADIKKFEDSNDLLGFAVAAYRVSSPTVGELFGYFKTYQGRREEGSGPNILQGGWSPDHGAVEISWDFDGRTNALTLSPGDKPGATKTTFFSQSNDLLSRLKEAEGEAEHLYRDKNGVVSLGIGHNASDREAIKKLPFVRKSDGQAATPEEIEKEWDAVKALPANKKLSFYEEKTKLSTRPRYGRFTFSRRCHSGRVCAAAAFPRLRSILCAARALLDMSYNVGRKGCRINSRSS